MNNNLTLYAIWRKEVKVTYDSNKGIGTLSSDSCYKYNAELTCDITLKNNVFTREGYTFKGWSKGVNSAVDYNVNTMYSFPESITLYAGWKANELVFRSGSIR